MPEGSPPSFRFSFLSSSDKKKSPSSLWLWCYNTSSTNFSRIFFCIQHTPAGVSLLLSKPFPKKPRVWAGPCSSFHVLCTVAYFISHNPYKWFGFVQGFSCLFGMLVFLFVYLLRSWVCRFFNYFFRQKESQVIFATQLPVITFFSKMDAIEIIII